MTTKPMLKQKDENGDSWLVQLQRIIDPTKPVQVYRNLHKACWSIRQGGKVRAHALYISLKDCSFVVGEKTRQRVIAEKKKYVHAFVQGIACDPQEIPPHEDWSEISYNPYKAGHFYTVGNEAAVNTAEHVDMMIDEDWPVMARGLT